MVSSKTIIISFTFQFFISSNTEIQVGQLLDTVEYDYPQFHLTMHCYLCTIKSGKLELKEHEAAKWLTKDTLESVEWLPADLGLIEKMKNNHDLVF